MIKNKFAIVTGASTGIGRAIAVAFAKKGTKIALVARTKDRLQQTKDLVEKAGGQAEIFPADLSKLDSLNDLISRIKSKTKKVDILVNVAGIWHGENEVYAGRNFADFPQPVILDTFFVGTIAPTILAHAFVPLMGRGSKIINISGTFESGAKGWLPYYVSKRAIEDLTVGLSEELKEKEIQVNAISPSDTATDAYKKYFPQYLEEAIKPEEIAAYAVYLCENNLTGKVIVLKKNQEPFEGFHR